MFRTGRSQLVPARRMGSTTAATISSGMMLIESRDSGCIDAMPATLRTMLSNLTHREVTLPVCSYLAASLGRAVAQCQCVLFCDSSRGGLGGQGFEFTVIVVQASKPRASQR